MSMTICAYFHRKKYPGKEAMRAVLAEHGFDWSLDEELDQDEPSGFQPGKLNGHETGVEIYGWEVERDEDFEEIADLVGKRDAVLMFRFSSSLIEAAFALTMCAALSKLAGAVIIDDDFEMMSVEDCLEEARECYAGEVGGEVPPVLAPKKKLADPYDGKPRLTPELIKKITADWNSYFPELSVYKDRWLMKRFGPVVFCLLLEKKSDPTEYYPLFHSDILLSDKPRLALMTCSSLRDKRGFANDRMTARSHDEWIIESGPRMRSQLPFRIDRYLKFYDYEKFVIQCMSSLSTSGSSMGHLEILVLLRAYLGLPYEFMLQNGVSIMKKWFEDSIKDSPYHKGVQFQPPSESSYLAFVEELRAKASNRKALHENYMRNLAALKLEKIAADELIPE